MQRLLFIVLLGGISTVLAQYDGNLENSKLEKIEFNENEPEPSSQRKLLKTGPPASYPFENSPSHGSAKVEIKASAGYNKLNVVSDDTPKAKEKALVSPQARAKAQDSSRKDKKSTGQSESQSRTTSGCSSDVLFIVDSTGSVKSIFEDHKSYVLNTIEGLSISKTGDQVGVVLFSGPHRQKEKIRLGEFLDNVKLTTKVRELPFMSGITATGAALNFAKKALEHRRPHFKTNVVVITDGFSYDLVEEASKNLRQLPDVTVYAIAVGESFVQKELEAIAGSESRVLHGNDSYKKLLKFLKPCGGAGSRRDAGAKGNRPNAGNEGEATVEVEGSGAGVNVIENPKPETLGKYGSMKGHKNIGVDRHQLRTAENRRADLAAPTCENDIVFVFDASGSISNHFQQQLVMANQLVNSLVIGPSDSQVAAIKYAGKHTLKVLFDFFNMGGKEQIQRTIAHTIFSSGTTYTNRALIKAVDIFKTGGARPHKARPIVIVFTDGYSGDNPIEGATLLREMGITVYAIGLDSDSNSVNKKELEAIASSKNHIYYMSNFSEFVNDMEKLGKTCFARKQRRT